MLFSFFLIATVADQQLGQSGSTDLETLSGKDPGHVRG